MASKKDYEKMLDILSAMAGEEVKQDVVVEEGFVDIEKEEDIWFDFDDVLTDDTKMILYSK